MLRTFGLVTLTGNAQPFIGDVTTAATTVAPSGNSTFITVANTALYQPGVDRIVLEPGTVRANSYRVQRIVSATVLACGTPPNAVAHASGSIIQLATDCMDVIVQAKAGNAASVYIGDSSFTVTNVPAGLVLYEIGKVAAGVQAPQWNMNGSGQVNNTNSAEGSMVGTAGDKVYTYALVQ